MSFIKNLSWRYATKKFDLNKKVSTENLEKIFEAIRLAPSSFGLQPIKILHVTDQTKREELKKFSWDQSQITDASELLIFCVRKDLKNRIEEYFDLLKGNEQELNQSLQDYKHMVESFENNLPEQDKIYWSARQLYIALGFAMAACAELEIDSCPMEGFDRDAYKKYLNLPENIIPFVCLTIGYRDESDQIRPKVRFSKEDLFTRI